MVQNSVAHACRKLGNSAPCAPQRSQEDIQHDHCESALRIDLMPMTADTSKLYHLRPLEKWTILHGSRAKLANHNCDQHHSSL